ncbi:ANTAR domain-containing protein [Nocardioides sp. SOB77]|uniref:ANTAR domain-containing protein n=1 Tax=Nocardioides oceani TaxID=3058369 RepID=A0ABT8FJ68_9ACTN|nr:ANTAR domain-containing protein [Nocardioides oceani]MDN4174437.1 ANTAR domain-containing protein [Nocardioides oceani]
MPTPSSGRPASEDADAVGWLGAMRTRLDSLGAGAGADRRSEVAALVAHLETAYEELRVADEEARAQHDHITRLVERENLLRWQQERMLAVLPVPVVTTDPDGIVRAVNAAAAGLLARRVSRLVGEPLLALLSADDRPDLRHFLDEGAEHDRTLRRVVTLEHRDLPAETVELQVTVFPGAGEINWLVLGGHGQEPSRSEHAAHRMAPALVQLINLPGHVGSSSDALRAAVRTCADALGGGCAVSLVVGAPVAPEAVATSDETASACDGAQLAAGEGPCQAAYEVGEVVVCEDLAHDERWPGFAARAPEGVQAVVSAPTDLGGRRTGALNVYLPVAGPTATYVEGVVLLAAAIGSALHEIGLRGELERLSGDMQRALDSRATIDQAKGIVMAARRCTPDEAFAHLTDLASTRHVKLRELAAQIVAGAARPDTVG